VGAEAVVCLVALGAVLAGTQRFTCIGDGDGAAHFELDSQVFELGPLLLPLDDPLAALDYPLGVLVPLDLGHVAARLIDLALDQILPASIHFFLSVLGRLLNTDSKIINSPLPSLRDIDLDLIDDFFTAQGTLIASLEQSSVLVLSLSEGSLKDSLALCFEFGRGHSAEPASDLLLDLLEVSDRV